MILPTSSRNSHHIPQNVPQDIPPNIPLDNMQTEDNSIPDIHVKPQIVQQSKEDDRKAKYLELARFIIVFILCFGYFLYEMTRYYNPQYNQQQLSAINKITTIYVPFIQLSTKFNTTTINCPSFVEPEKRWDNEHNSTEICNVINTPNGYYPYSTNWTIYYNTEMMEIFLIPPYNQIMTVNDTLFITIQSVDDNNGNITEVGDYLLYLEDMNNDLLESIVWTERAINDPNEIDFTASTRTSLTQLMYSKTGTRTDGEIDIVELNKFNDINMRYGLDYRVSNPYGSNIQFIDGRWSRQSLIALNINTLHTKTVIVVTQKITFIDVLALTGGIFGLIWPGSLIVVAFLLTGFKWKCIIIPGIAPNFGLKDEEKRKTMIYLKEIDVVQDTEPYVV